MARVLVGMSGGVDSSVAALLLKQQGYDVVGVTLNLWGKERPEVVDDARAVCEKLEIEYEILDFHDVFQEKVIDYFANEYIRGRTPNPCNACNRHVKFEALLLKAVESMNCDYIATGHYAKVEQDEITGRYFLRKSEAAKKDQTYALYNLTQDQLKRTLMPLGDYTKEEVRKIAEENGLVNANRKDSQEICFVEDNDYIRFIKKNYGYTPEKGNFVDVDGNVLGEHQGIIYYTVGQRKGLGIAFQKHMYVLRIDVEKNEVVLGEKEELFSKSLICDEINLMMFERLEKPISASVKIRYSATAEPATLIPLEDGKIKVEFSVPQRAITPGQAAVFYNGDAVIGGGTIL